MERSTPGPTGSTWKPSAPLDKVPAARKGPAASEGGPLKRGVTAQLVLQGVFLVLLLGAAFLARDEARSMWLYVWTGVIPVGFGVVYFLAWRRRERVRAERRWTLAWEKAEAKRAYLGLGGVLLVWAVGLVLVFALVG